jgi:hypothetical protein
MANLFPRSGSRVELLTTMFLSRPVASIRLDCIGINTYCKQKLILRQVTWFLQTESTDQTAWRLLHAATHTYFPNRRGAILGNKMIFPMVLYGYKFIGRKLHEIRSNIMSSRVGATDDRCASTICRRWRTGARIRDSNSGWNGISAIGLSWPKTSVPGFLEYLVLILHKKDASVPGVAGKIRGQN